MILVMNIKMCLHYKVRPSEHQIALPSLGDGIAIKPSGYFSNVRCDDLCPNGFENLLIEQLLSYPFGNWSQSNAVER
jgi:hypothetical protein